MANIYNGELNAPQYTQLNKLLVARLTSHPEEYDRMRKQLPPVLALHAFRHVQRQLSK
jgi:hypothetical protein